MRHSRVDRRTLWPFLLDPEDDDAEDEWLIRGCIGTPWEMYNLASSKASECSPRTYYVVMRSNKKIWQEDRSVMRKS